MEACRACMNSLSECILTLVCKHASPASKLCSQDMRIACSARMCGRPAAAPYPGLRPSAVRQCERGRPAAVHCPGVRPCKRGEPAAVPYPGVRPRASAAGLRPYLIPASGRVSAAGYMLYRSPVLKGLKIMMKNVWRQKCHLPTNTYTQNSRSPIHYVPKDFYYN